MTTPRSSFTDDLLLDLDRGVASPINGTTALRPLETSAALAAAPGGTAASAGLAGSAGSVGPSAAADAPLSGSWALTPRAWALPTLRRTIDGLEAAAGPVRLAIQLRR